MKKNILIFAAVLLATAAKAQTVQKYNSITGRTEFFDTYGNMIGYAEKDALSMFGRINYYDRNGNLIQYQEKDVLSMYNRVNTYDRYGNLTDYSEKDPLGLYDRVNRYDKYGNSKGYSEKDPLSLSDRVNHYDSKGNGTGYTERDLLQPSTKHTYGTEKEIKLHKKWNSIYSRYDVYTEDGKKIGHYTYDPLSKKWKFTESPW